MCGHDTAARLPEFYLDQEECVAGESYFQTRRARFGIVVGYQKPEIRNQEQRRGADPA
jgi:hypothetical protein